MTERDTPGWARLSLFDFPTPATLPAVLGQQKQLGGAPRRGQHAGHRLKRHDFFGEVSGSK